MPILTDGEGTAIRIVGNQIFLDVDAVEATMIDSTGATSGHVLTADGSNGASWQPQTGGLAAADIDTLAELNAIVSDATLVDEADILGRIDAVSGGAGFTNVSGAVTLDLSAGRSFHHTMTGNITSLAFSNIPTTTVYSTVWTWVLAVDATGGYTLASMPTVTWTDGSSFDDLDLSANAVNIVTFWQVGSTIYATLVTNGSLRLDPYAISFPEDGTALIVVDRAETIDLGNVRNVEADGTAGTGTLSFKKNGTTATGSTSFAAGDVLEVTMASSTTASAVAIPRYAA